MATRVPKTSETEIDSHELAAPPDSAASASGISSASPDDEDRATWDVVILGAGLAGLTLARHLLLHTDRRVLLLEKQEVLPPVRQKVGESTVQLAGYYLSEVLELEDHLLRQHFMKYNLRFYWPSEGQGNANFEDYSAGYIRPFSNIPSYQVDRNALEGELLRLVREDPRCEVITGVSKLTPSVAVEPGDERRGRGSGEHHRVRFEVGPSSQGMPIENGPAEQEVTCRWVVDTTGRRNLVSKVRKLKRKTPIRHGAVFWWVDGGLPLQELTDLSAKERRLHPNRRHVGHLPNWLATNHFCAEGLWFWVIPLRGRTSLGLVFDQAVVDFKDVANAEKATRWVCERFPLFAHTLPGRETIDFGGFKSYSHDSTQTLSPDRWAMSGEAGRFSDPLYSPGSDLIAVHNTLIVDAIQTPEGPELESKCQLHESIAKAVFRAYMPSYATSYDCLGDQECFSLKYAWELQIYFALLVFPFINDLFTDRRFAIAFLRQFSRLGPWNRGLQSLLSGFYQWKKSNGPQPDGPQFLDFMEIGNLSKAEKTFYEVGLTVAQAKTVLHEQMGHLEEMARFLAVHVAAVVLDDPAVYTNRAFVEALDLDHLAFDVAEFRRRWESCKGQSAAWEWSFCHRSLEVFRNSPAGPPAPVSDEASAEISAEISEPALQEVIS